MQDSPLTRDARRLRRQVIGGSVLLLVLYIAARLGLHAGPIVVQQQPPTEMAAGRPLIGDGVMVLLAVAIFWLTEALRGIIEAGLFSTVTVRRFRRFAAWLMSMALFRLFAPVILEAIQPHPNGPSAVILILDIPDLLLVGITLLLFLVARMLERARLIQEEMSEIV